MKGYTLSFRTHGAYIFLTTLLAYCFVYGFEISHFTLSTDEEFADNLEQTLSLGRWGHTLLHHYILPEPWLPFFTIMLGITFLALSSLYICRYLNLDLTLSIIFSLLTVGLPQAAFQLQFSNQADTYGIAVFLSCYSMQYLKKNTLKSSMLFVLINAFAISIYQASIMTPVTLYLIKSMFDYFRCDRSHKASLLYSLKMLLRMLACLVVSYLIYKLVLAAMLKIFNVTSSGYLGDFIGWHQGVLHGLKYGLGSVAKYTSYKFAPYGMKLFCLIIPALLIIFIIALKAKKFDIFIFSLLALFSVFAINILLGANLPPRSLIQAPLVFAGLITFVIYALKRKEEGVYLSVVMMFLACMFSSRLFYSDYMTREADAYVAQNIVMQIGEKLAPIDDRPVTVFFIGKMTPKNAWRVEDSDTFGLSFFEWNRFRLQEYLRTTNLADYAQPSENKINALVAYSKSMPSWPAKESIGITQGIVVVKLGNQNTELENY